MQEQYILFKELDMFLDGVSSFIYEQNLNSNDFKCIFIGAEYHEEQKRKNN